MQRRRDESAGDAGFRQRDDVGFAADAAGGEDGARRGALAQSPQRGDIGSAAGPDAIEGHQDKAARPELDTLLDLRPSEPRPAAIMNGGNKAARAEPGS